MVVVCPNGVEVDTVCGWLCNNGGCVDVKLVTVYRIC